MTLNNLAEDSRDHGINAVTRCVSLATVCRWLAATLAAGLLAIPTIAPAADSTAGDRTILAALDTAYQKAVEQNDAKTMARLLADDFVVYDGDGKSYTKADLLKSATDGSTRYEHQQDSEQTVRVWGNTAVVTAKLWVKGIEDGAQVDYVEWFSDTYVRTPSGWQYVFGQASLPLPKLQKR